MSFSSSCDIAGNLNSTVSYSRETSIKNIGNPKYCYPQVKKKKKKKLAPQNKSCLFSKSDPRSPLVASITLETLGNFLSHFSVLKQSPEKYSQTLRKIARDMSCDDGTRVHAVSLPGRLCRGSCCHRRRALARFHHTLLRFELYSDTDDAMLRDTD